MNFLAVQRILGLLVMLVSVTMLPPLGVSVYYGDGNWQPFSHAFFALLAAGTLIWWPVRSRVRELRRRDGFLVVALFWFVVSAAGAVPLLLTQEVQLSVTNAVFESVSGYTTTGATVLSGMESLPKSLLWYRVQMEWLGGIGMVVLAVALLPMLGIGGMQLMRAETPGPIKDSKLTPRITGTAKELCRIYIAFTIACAVAYKLAGMTTFDAIAHSFSTVSTGGNATHDGNFAYFDNEVIEGIAVFFMFLGSVNFSLHFLAWRHKRLSAYFRDPEFRAYCWLLALAIAVYFAVLWLSRPDVDAGAAFRRSLFHAVSMQSTTAFFTDDFTHWPGALPVILMLSTFIGGCAGSTSGGMKVVRWLLLWKQGQREVVQLVHPSAEVPVKLGEKAIDPRIVDAVWGFFGVYIVAFGALMVLLIATGEDQVTAFSAIAACMNNAGTGLGEVAANFATLSDPGKWICLVAMLLGRLEVFPLLVLVSPTFWRR
jgi:trk system potassium uptake protein TrkH